MIILILIILIILVAYFMSIIFLVRNGRNKFKGAKKRRAKFFPFLWKPKEKKNDK